MRRKLFTILAITSALLCAGTVVLWVRSFRADSHVGFDVLGARYTVQSTWGRVALLGPPDDGPEDPAAATLASRMSADDFDWGSPGERREGSQVRGDVRRGTPTWEMFQRFHHRLPDRSGMDPATRVWLKALDDPRAFVPAHMLLSLRFDRWRDATVWDGVPTVYMAVDLRKGRPLLARRAALRDEWYERLATPPLASVSCGWVVLATLVLPVAWVARPRQRTTKGRARSAAAWAFNAAAVASVTLCVAGVAAWVRSHWVADRWFFAPRPRNTTMQFEGRPEPVVSVQSIASSAGRLEFHETIVSDIDLSRYGTAGAPPRYMRSGPAPLTATFWLGFARSAHLTGERQWKVPGIEYGSLPLQQVNAMRGPAPAPPQVPKWQTSRAEALGPPSPFGPTTTTAPADPAPPPPPPVPPGSFSSVPMLMSGQRSLVISWWLPVLCSAILPAIWSRGAWSRWRAARRERRRNLCPSCGYDLRATPERCPECGRIAAKIDTPVGRG